MCTVKVVFTEGQTTPEWTSPAIEGLAWTVNSTARVLEIASGSLSAFFPIDRVLYLSITEEA